MQELFLEELVNGMSLRVIKTYDPDFADEAFGDMDGEALDSLSASLDLQSKFDVSDIPASTDEGYADFIWDEVLDSAREDGNTLSLFVVCETRNEAVHNCMYLPIRPAQNRSCSCV